MNDFFSHVNLALNHKGEVCWDSNVMILSCFQNETIENFNFIQVSPIHGLFKASDTKLIGISFFFIEHLLNDQLFVDKLFENDYLPLSKVATGMFKYIDNRQSVLISTEQEQAIEFIKKNNFTIPKTTLATIYLDHINHNNLTLQ